MNVRDILPLPFSWINIPDGSVTIHAAKSRSSYIPRGSAKAFSVSAFAIAKYPVTNAQFAKFIDAGGYTERRWWTAKGWDLKTRGNWSTPLFWQKHHWNQSNYPVVGVSWFESVAFCKWLSEMTNESITLPTEQQWQHAAQGDTNWEYAWGNDYEPNRCNWGKPLSFPQQFTREEVIAIGVENMVDKLQELSGQGTTPVTQYEDIGNSPYGVVDMNGNVWEWTLTANETGDNTIDGGETKIIRGGGWETFNAPEGVEGNINLGNTVRQTLATYERLKYVGLRIIRI